MQMLVLQSNSTTQAVCLRVVHSSFLAAVSAPHSTRLPVLSPDVLLLSSLCVVCCSAHTTSGYSPHSTWSPVECLLQFRYRISHKPHTTRHAAAQWKPLLLRSSSVQRNYAAAHLNLSLEFPVLFCIVDKALHLRDIRLSNVVEGSEDRTNGDMAVT